MWQNLNGNRNCPYLNRNGSKRNLNLNWIENDWNDLCRFVAVRQSLRSSSLGLVRGSFVLGQLFPPTAEHPANFRQGFRDANVFVIVERFQFPGNPQEKLQRIEFRASAANNGQFLVSCRISCQQDEFDALQEQSVDLFAEREAGKSR